MSGYSSPNIIDREPTTRIRVVNDRGEVTLAADLPVLYRAQRQGRVELVIGAGRTRVSLSIQFATLEDICDDTAPPVDLRDRARAAEDYVLSQLEL